MTRRLASVTLALGLCLAAQSAHADALLRSRVIVEGESVTLGDLFDNIGDKGEKVVLRAPAPGARVTLDSEWLHRVATANGIGWHSQDLFAQAVVERAAQTVGRDQLTALLQTALAAKGAPEESLIETEGRPLAMLVPANSAAQIAVRDLFYDRDSGRFTASIAAIDQGRDVARLPVAGKLVPCAMVPVAAHPIARGDMIGASDLRLQKMRQEEVRPAMITDEGALVGMTAKLNLRAGVAIGVADIQKPMAVTRGATVTMVLVQGGMLLTAQGRALDQGALGDVIRLSNTKTNLTVEGTIDGTNHVRVTLNGAIALAK
jgi:flagella basal body P-ring formation protein FlgA